MLNIKQFARTVGKLTAMIMLTVASACTTLIPSPNPQYNFTSADPQASIVAFTVSCAVYDIPTHNAAVYIDHANWQGNKHEHDILINCGNFPDLKSDLKILILPAGDYALSGIEIVVTSMMYTTIYSSKPGEKFYFTLKPHKLTYLGKINYEVTPNRVITTVANEDLGDAPIDAIKHAVPLISPRDYITAMWRKNGLNEFTPTMPQSSKFIMSSSAPKANCYYKGEVKGSQRIGLDTDSFARAKADVQVKTVMLGANYLQLIPSADLGGGNFFVGHAYFCSNLD